MGGRAVFGPSYLLKVLGIGVLCFGLGAWPALALEGKAGLGGLAIGIGIGLFGALLGHLPRLFFQEGPDAVFHAAFAGIGIRLFATLVLAALAFFLLPIPREPLAIGLVLSYLSLLAIEIGDLVAMGRQMSSSPERTQSIPSPQGPQAPQAPQGPQTPPEPQGPRPGGS